METKLIKIEGVILVAPAEYVPPFDRLDDFPDCCGAGKGIGQRIVPEKILGLRVSAACDIHDYSFEHAEATWAEFHAASFRLVRNISAIIRAKSNWLTGLFRTMIASVYYYSVDTIGAKVFERLKNSQGKLMR